MSTWKYAAKEPTIEAKHLLWLPHLASLSSWFLLMVTLELWNHSEKQQMKKWLKTD